MPDVPPEFIRAHTRPVRTELVPEVELLIAADVVALWEAMETEQGRTSTDPPFWAAAWPGGQALARYVLDNPGLVAGKAVLDLGAGSGLVAVAAVQAGATSVLASDVDPFALTAIAVNAERNAATGITPVGNVLDREPPEVAVVLAGDVCYDREMTDRVLPFLEAARARGAEVLVGDPGRVYLPEDRLSALATYDVPDTEPSPDRPAPIRRTTVWRLP
ncbi:class I SAM-dependent methyltransferase [Blastococcus atacamensis]|uniref:class I SAM-dependent methyltransferase n=1 Tax=Blastococcus atacamensis TaxID=2070508 RepID=UPI000CEC368F|nr:50S ribosomal protein L11 methyltransferase [Blastococcus atacamensis]